jgi:hypothetical protein
MASSNSIDKASLLSRFVAWLLRSGVGDPLEEGSIRRARQDASRVVNNNGIAFGFLLAVVAAPTAAFLAVSSHHKWFTLALAAIGAAVVGFAAALLIVLWWKWRRAPFVQRNEARELARKIGLAVGASFHWVENSLRLSIQNTGDVPFPDSEILINLLLPRSWRLNPAGDSKWMSAPSDEPLTLNGQPTPALLYSFWELKPPPPKITNQYFFLFPEPPPPGAYSVSVRVPNYCRVDALVEVAHRPPGEADTVTVTA